MPNGRFHDAATVVTGVALFPVAYVVNHTFVADTPALQLACAYSVAHFISGLWLSPDLDHHTVALKRWGWFAWIWRPYRTYVEHRSWISHSFLISGLLRVVYIASFVWMILRFYGLFDAHGATYISAYIVSQLTDVWHLYTAYVWNVLIGITTGSDVHVLADQCIHTKQPRRSRAP